jgi:hypothetical protein
MNNLTKIAALPTGGGCQSALRPEDRGAAFPTGGPVSPGAPQQLVPILIGMDRAKGESVTIINTFTVGDLATREMAQQALAASDRRLALRAHADAARNGARHTTITAAAQPGEQVEAVSIEPGQGLCIGVPPTLTLNFGGPPSDIDVEQFRRGLARLRAAADRAFWPERCRADLKGGAA